MAASNAAPPLPPHDPAPWALVPATTIAQWPVGSFLENLVIADDGTVYASVHPTGEVFRVPSGATAPAPLGTIPAPVAGLVLDDAHGLFVMTGFPGKAPAAVWTLSLAGEAAHWADVPGAVFLNGAVRFDAHSLLVVDSITGAILRVGTSESTVSAWYQDPCLTQRPDTPLFPGANGIKRRGDTIIVSNTDRGQIYAVAIAANGSAGAAVLLADRLLFDDFAVGADGALYGCAHAFNQLLRLTPEGGRTILAGAEQGIVNPTAAAFGRAAGDHHALYVTTTGGVAAPLPSGLEPARLVRLNLSGVLNG